MNEAISKLKLDMFGIELVQDGDTYSSMIIDSNLYQDIFDYFGSLDFITLDEDSVELDEDKQVVDFKNDDIVVTLDANFKDDSYSIKVRGA